MTSTPALPNAVVPLEPTTANITKDQGLETVKDIVYGSVSDTLASPSPFPHRSL